MNLFESSTYNVYIDKNAKQRCNKRHIKAHNVRSVKKDTKHISVLLLGLVSFFTERTLKSKHSSFSYQNLAHTLQMLTDKLLINYYFHMLLLQVKMCKLFKGGWLLILQTIICFFCCLIQNYIQTTDR